MNFLSNIGNAIGSAYNSVVNTVGGWFGGGSSQTATPMNFNVGSNLNNYGAAPTPTGQSGAVTYYNNAKPNNTTGYVPLAPYAGLSGNVPAGASFGTNPSVNTNGAIASGGLTPAKQVSYSSGAGALSNYSSPSYSSGLNTADLSSLFQAAPSTFTVGSSTLGAGTTATTMPSAPSGTNYAGNVHAGNISVGANPTTGLIGTPSLTSTTGTPVAGTNSNKDTTGGNNSAVKSVQDYLTEQLGLYKTPSSEADQYTKAVAQTGLLQAQQQRLNTQNAINAVTSKMHADLLNLRGTAGREGVTEAVYGGQQAEVTREATVQLLPLQAQLAADQGNLDLAQTNTNTLFKIYADDAKNSADFYNENVKRAYDLFTVDEKKHADALLWQKNFNADQVKQDSQNQNTIANELLKAGDTAGYKAVTAIRPPTNLQSPTFAEDYANYKKDLSNAITSNSGALGALQKVQLNNARLEGQKLQNEVNAKQPATGEYAPVINAVSGLVGATKAPAIKSAISSSLANGDFSTAYANIANAVEDSLTGSNKTKFADTRTDIGVMTGMRDAIQNYVNQGGSLGFLKGKADAIAKNFGQLETDPKFAALGVQLTREFQSYRLAMTGAAFSPAESREYAAVNPRTDASLDLNLATIDGALAQLNNRVTSTVNERIPEASKIYDLVHAKNSLNQQTNNPFGQSLSGGASSQVYNSSTGVFNIPQH